MNMYSRRTDMFPRMSYRQSLLVVAVFTALFIICQVLSGIALTRHTYDGWDAIIALLGMVFGLIALWFAILPSRIHMRGDE